MANLQLIITADASGAVLNVKRFRDEVSKVGPTASTASTKTTTAFDRMHAVIGKARSAVIGFIAAFAVAAIIRQMSELLSITIDFNTAMARVRKTVGGSEADIGALEGQFREMAKTLPGSATDLARVAQAAARFGVQAQDLQEFTRVAVTLGEAIDDMDATDAAQSLAQLAGITGTTADKMFNLGSVVALLGDTTKTTEKAILDMSTRFAAAGNLAGLSAQEILAFAAAAGGVGIPAERGGTAIQKFLLALTEAVAVGGTKLQTFASVTGLSMEEFRRVFEEDATDAIELFFRSLGQIDDASKFQALRELGLNAERIKATILSLAAAENSAAEGVDKLSDKNRIANEEFEVGQKLVRELNIVMDTYKIQLENILNRYEDHIITLGDKLLPKMIEYGETIADILDATVEWADKNDTLVTAIASVAGGLAAMKLAAWVASMQLVKTAVQDVTVAFLAAGGGTVGLSAGLYTLFGRVTLIGGIIGGTVVTMRLMADTFKEINEGIERQTLLEEQLYITKIQTGQITLEELKHRSEQNQAIRNQIELQKTQLENEAMMEAARQDVIRQLAELRDRQLEVEESTTGLSEAAQDLVDDFYAVTDDADTLNEALGYLLDAGIPVQQLWKEFGPDIEKAKDKLHALGLEIPSLVDGLEDMLPKLEKIDDLWAGGSAGIAALTERYRIFAPKVDVAVESLGNFFEVVDDNAKAVGRQRNEMDRLEETLAAIEEGTLSNQYVLGIYGDEIQRAAKLAEELGIPLGEATQKFHDMQEEITANEKAAKRMEDAMATAMGNVVTDMAKGLARAIVEWESFGESLKNIAKDLAENLLSAFLTGFFAPLTLAMQDLGRSLSGVLGGLGSKLGISSLTGWLTGAGSSAAGTGATVAGNYMDFFPGGEAAATGTSTLLGSIATGGLFAAPTLVGKFVFGMGSYENEILGPDMMAAILAGQISPFLGASQKVRNTLNLLATGDQSSIDLYNSIARFSLGIDDAGTRMAGLLGNFLTTAGIQQFGRGIDYVPYDMLAMIHKGERVVPASENMGGNAPVNLTFHINAIDGQSVRDVVRKKIVPELREVFRTRGGLG